MQTETRRCRRGQTSLLMTVPPDAVPPRPPRKGRTPRSGEKIDSPATMELQRRFGADFKAARIAAGLTQADVARLIEAPDTNVSQVENGKRNLTIDAMRRLAVAVGCGLVLHLNPLGAPLSARLEREPPKRS